MVHTALAVFIRAFIQRGAGMDDFSHYAKDGRATMVDVSGKDETQRIARAAGFVAMKPETLDNIQSNLNPKGNPFEVARIAGIMAAKRTAELIPLCHPLLLTFIDVAIAISADRTGVAITAEVRLTGKTGVEMEALTAVSVAALTIYDMCKAVDKTMNIKDIHVIEKRGGKSDYVL
jgi:cyclic pyranopterin monophosphate synthase